MIHIDLDEFRAFEVMRVCALLCTELDRPGPRLLEVGAGSGFQAAQFERNGYAVSAIDVRESNLGAHRVWPVQDYDGRTIPFPDEQFDVVFSSNVLEHVRDLDRLEQEMSRVLKNDGLAIHVLPSPTWRIWSSLTHYVHLGKRAAAVLAKLPQGLDASRSEASSSFVVERPLGERIARIVLPGRHGERGNACTETYYFSRLWWREHFTNAGWEVVRIVPTGIFYTGYGAFGQSLSIARRQRLAAVLGSAAAIFQLRKTSRCIN